MRAAGWPCLISGKVPAPTRTRLTELGGDDYYVHASDGGLFEPLVDLQARAGPLRAGRLPVPPRTRRIAGVNRMG